MEPLFLQPDYKERVWGGQKLKEIFGKPIPYEHTGESWEVASHFQGCSIIKNGIYQGKTLKEVFENHKDELVGKGLAHMEKFPLLVKFLDAEEVLSVQVHPEDFYALKNENGEYGKAEAWYIIETEPSANLIVGLKDGITKEEFVKALQEERVNTVLNYIPVKKGDVIYVPSGLVHALGKGIVVVEVEQNSDVTYRIYDWGRVGLDGEKRELHVDKSLDVIDFCGKHAKKILQGEITYGEGYEKTHYITCSYFVLEKVRMKGQYYVKDKEDFFEIFCCLDGTMELLVDEQAYTIHKGDSFLLPASIRKYKIIGHGELLKAYVPLTEEVN